MLSAKHVSLSAQGVNQLAIAAVLEFTTQAGDVNLDDITEPFPVEVIQMFKQLGLGYHRARPVRQIFQNAVFHRCEADKCSLAAHREIGRVDLQIANLQHRRTLSLAAPDQGFGAGQKFSQVEGLGNVVVAVRLTSFPLRRTERSAVLISRSPTFNTAALCPLPRRIRALARARSSPRSKGLAT